MCNIYCIAGNFKIGFCNLIDKPWKLNLQNVEEHLKFGCHIISSIIGFCMYHRIPHMPPLFFFLHVSMGQSSRGVGLFTRLWYLCWQPLAAIECHVVNLCIWSGCLLSINGKLSHNNYDKQLVYKLQMQQKLCIFISSTYNAMIIRLQASPTPVMNLICI